MSYSSAELKLARAREHLNAFATELGAFEAQQPYRIAAAREGNDIVLRVHDLLPMPARLALIAGDVVHNARSALDHLVVSIANEGGGTLGRPPTEDEERRLYFPITDSEATFRQAKTTLEKHVANDVLTRMQILQPYTIELLPEYSNLDDWQRRALINASLLRRLSVLDNIDKHRRLALALWFPGSVGENRHGLAEATGQDVSSGEGEPDDSVEDLGSRPLTEEELAWLTELSRAEAERPDAYDFYFGGGGALVEGDEIGRYMRNDRGPMPDLGPLDVELRVVLHERGLTGELSGAPPATETLEEMVEEAEFACKYVETGQYLERDTNEPP